MKNKAALSAEEWKMARVHVSLYPTGEDLMLQLGNRHGIAAAALHKQPFGFTREDVDLVLGIMDSEEFLCYARPEDNNRVQSLADRIEALLPPES